MILWTSSTLIINCQSSIIVQSRKPEVESWSFLYVYSILQYESLITSLVTDDSTFFLKLRTLVLYKRWSLFVLKKTVVRFWNIILHL